MSGGLSTRYIKQLAAADENEVPFTRCPLHWGMSDTAKIGFACHHKFGNWLVGSVATHYVLFDVMAGVGAFDLGAFPPDVNGSTQLREVMERSIRRWLAVDET